MSQITDHILDPYNVPVLTEQDSDNVKALIADDLTKLSLHEVFGYGKCKDSDWDNVLKRYLTIDMFSCTNATSLDGQQLSCLSHKLFIGIDRNVPCNKSLYSPY